MEKETKEDAVRVVVSREFKEGKRLLDSETKNETIAVRTFASKAGSVSLAKGVTCNLGNFESARLEISISVPCYLEEVDDAYTFADSWVESRLEVEMASIRKSKPGVF